MPPRAERHAPWLLAALVALAYAGSWSGAFQYDDFNVIVDNPVVHSWAALSADFGHGLRPVLKLSYWFSWVTGAGSPPAFHAFNLAVHLGNVLLVWALARRIQGIAGADPSTAARAALLAAAIFALHPLQTEAITYICGRSTSLMSLFCLAALLCWDRYLAARRLRDAVLAWLAFAGAAGTKEPALALPVALLLWESLRRPGGGWRARLLRHAPFWLLPVAALLVAVPRTGYAEFAIASLTERPLWHNAMSQVHALVWLLRGLLLLRAPNFDPDLPVIDRAGAALCAEAGLLLALLGTGLAVARRRPWLGFCLAWVVLQFLPTNSLMPRLDVANDRQWYLPLAGVAWAAGGMLARWTASRAALAWPAAAALLLALGLSTAQRNADYRSEIRLWQATLEQSPHKARAWNNYGVALRMAGRVPEARAAYARALELDPGFAAARQNLGLPPQLPSSSPQAAGMHIQ